MRFEEFCLLISEISNLPLEKIERHASFRDDLNIDSLQMVNLIVEISSKYGLEVTKIQSNDDLRTVGHMYESIMREV